MDTVESTMEHIVELVASTRTGGYEDFEVRLDNAEGADVKKQTDVNYGRQNEGDSSGLDVNGGSSPSKQNDTQEANSVNAANYATTIVVPATSFMARFGRSDGPMRLVRSHSINQIAASPLCAAASHRSVHSSNDFTTHSMDEEDRTENADMEHQTAAETKVEGMGGEGRTQSGRPQWAQSWTGGHAVEQNLFSECGTVHSSTFSMRSTDVADGAERPATAQPNDDEERLEACSVFSSFGIRWRHPRRPVLAQSWTCGRADDEATELTSMGSSRGASVMRRYESGSLFGGSESSATANKPNKSTASGQPVEAHHGGFPPPMGKFRSVPLPQSTCMPTDRDTTRRTAAKFSDMTMAFKQVGGFSSTSYDTGEGFFFPPPTGNFRSSAFLQNTSRRVPIDHEPKSFANSCLAQKFADGTTVSQQDGGFSAAAESYAVPEGTCFPRATGNFRTETASYSTAAKGELDIPCVEVGRAAGTVSLNGLLSTVEDLTASLGRLESETKPKAPTSVTAPRDGQMDVKCVTVTDNDWGALDLTLEYEHKETEHFSVHVSKLAELLNGYRVMNSFEFAGTSFDESYTGVLLQLREDFFRQCFLVMRNCDFRKMDPAGLATLFTSLIVYRISIVGDIRFPEGCTLFDLQIVKSSLSLTFRRVHDADPTTSLPKIEADKLVNQLYSEGKPRYVFLDCSQLSPDIKALIAAILEEDGKTESNAQFLLDVCTDHVPEALAGGALVFLRRLRLSISHDPLDGRLVLKRCQRGATVRPTTFECVMRSLGSSSPGYISLTDERVRWTLISLFGSSTAKALKRSTGASVPDINMPTEDTSKKEFLSFIESSFDRIYNIANEQPHLDNNGDDRARLLVEEFHQKVDQ